MLMRCRAIADIRHMHSSSKPGTSNPCIAFLASRLIGRSGHLLGWKNVSVPPLNDPSSPQTPHLASSQLMHALFDVPGPHIWAETSKSPRKHVGSAFDVEIGAKKGAAPNRGRRALHHAFGIAEKSTASRAHQPPRYALRTSSLCSSSWPVPVMVILPVSIT